MPVKSSRYLIIIPASLFPSPLTAVYIIFSKSMSRGHDNPDPAAPQTRRGPRFLLPSSLPSPSFLRLPRISRLVDLYRSSVSRYSAVRDSGQAALRSAGSKTCCHEAPGGACAREGASRRDERDGRWGEEGWDRTRVVMGTWAVPGWWERRECWDTLVACVGEQRRNGRGDGISLSFPCPRRDVRCPARAIGGVGNPRRTQSANGFPELSKSAVPELAPVPRHLADSRASWWSLARRTRPLGSSVFPTRVTCNGSSKFYSLIAIFENSRVFFHRRIGIFVG